MKGTRIMLPGQGKKGRDIGILDEKRMVEFCPVCEKKMKETTITNDMWSRQAPGTNFTIRRFCPDEQCNTSVDYYYSRRKRS